MKEVLLAKACLCSLTLILACILALLMIEKTHADYLGVLQAALPDRIEGWTAEPEDRFFDDQTIFDYIDGTGEVYRAYNMVKCLSRRYVNPKGHPIILDVFEMGSSKDAFGIFTHDQDGEALNFGQGALYRASWLSFWKDRFFISIYAEEETASAIEAVKKLGRSVASLITAEGLKPAILSLLPSQGLQPRSVRYLHHHLLLNYHFYLSDENILNLGSQTEAALARYQRGGKYAHLLLVLYVSTKKAQRAFASLTRHYLPDADSTGLALLENGNWAAAAVKGRLLTIVLEAEGRDLAHSLLQEAIEGSSRK